MTKVVLGYSKKLQSHDLFKWNAVKDVDQLNSVYGETYQSILPQPSVWQFGLIKELG